MRTFLKSFPSILVVLPSLSCSNMDDVKRQRSPATVSEAHDETASGQEIQSSTSAIPPDVEGEVSDDAILVEAEDDDLAPDVMGEVPAEEEIGTFNLGATTELRLAPTMDTYIYQMDPEKTNGLSTTLRTLSSSTAAREILIKFSMSNIPQNVEVQKVRLQLYSQPATNFKADSTTSLYANLASWSAVGTSWSNKPARASTPSSTIAVNVTGKYVSWDITPLGRDWYAGTRANHGITLRARGGGNLYFNSRESTSNRPVLIVEYAPIVLTNQPPTVSLSATPASGPAPLNVAFTAVASDSDGSIASYRWDFQGDGTIDQTTTTNTISYTYANMGSYNARVTVDDNDAATAIASFSVSVTSAPPISPPAASATDAPNPASCTANPIQKSVCASGCDYNTIQACTNAWSAGWTCNVQTGTYNLSSNLTLFGAGTLSQPRCLVEAPGHTVKITSTNYAALISINSRYIVLGGPWVTVGSKFEITGIRRVLVAFEGHVTISGNWIHDNSAHGIIGAPPHILIEGNIIEANGKAGGNCAANPGVNYCHQIYINSTSEAPGGSHTIRKNIIKGGPGAGLQARNIGGTGNKNNLVENNLFLNNYHGISMPNGGTGLTLRNNTFAVTSIPMTSEDVPTHLLIFASSGLTVKNNIFYSNASTYNGDAFNVVRYHGSGTATHVFTHNLWFNVASAWRWQGAVQANFNGNFTPVTGTGGSSVYGSDPLFVNQVDFRIPTGSPAKNVGENATCASTDFFGTTRPQGAVCDMGYFEY